MNNDQIQRLLSRGALIFTLITHLFVLTACGDDNDDKDSSSSSSSSSSSFSSSSASSLPTTAVWPDLNVATGAPKTLTFSWTAVEGATSYQLLKNTDGSSGYVEVGDPVTTTSASDSMVSVHLYDWDDGSYMVEACIDSVCQNSNPVNTAGAMINAIGYFKASNTEANDWFGWSVDLSADGNTMVVSAPPEDSNATGIDGDQTSNTSISAGAVYVFALVDGTWAQQAYIKASNTEQPNDDADLTLTNDRFGYRVALSDDGNTLAVSALMEDSLATGIDCNQGNLQVWTTDDDDNIKTVPYDINIGAVYVFTRTGTTWTQQTYLKPSNVYSDHQFGYSLALAGDGDTLVVGSINESAAQTGIGSSSSSSNAARCENANASPVSSSSTSSSSSSSSSVSSSASSSSSLTVGGSLSGAVYVYHRADNAWSEEAYIKASNANTYDAFGTSVALSANGDVLAVGAPNEDSSATGINGDETINTTVYVNYSYVQLNSGAVYVFDRTGSTWAQNFYIKPDHVSWSMLFGTSVDLSADGKTLAVGAPNEISRATGINGDPKDYDLYDAENSLFPSDGSLASGAAYIFAFDGTTWDQTTYFKASNPEAGDKFGSKVRLSGSGNVFAVGSIIEASLASGINGDAENNSAANTGAVYVFKLDGSWQQKAYVKPSNTKGGERFGSAIGLSDDGSTMAVGAYREASKATGVNGDQTDTSAVSAGAVYLY